MEWQDNGKQLTEHHRITKGKHLKHLQKAQGDKDKGEYKGRASAAAFAAETELLFK